MIKNEVFAVFEILLEEIETMRKWEKYSPVVPKHNGARRLVIWEFTEKGIKYLKKEKKFTGQ